MKKVAFLFVLLCLLSKPLMAMWVALPDDQLVAQSDLIVVGTLTEVHPDTGSKGTSDIGFILVAETWKGAPDLTRVILGMPSATQLRSSSDLIYRPNDRGLWFLRQDPRRENQFLADHPSRFIPAANGSRIETLRRLLK